MTGEYQPVHPLLALATTDQLLEEVQARMLALHDCREGRALGCAVQLVRELLPEYVRSHRPAG